MQVSNTIFSSEQLVKLGLVGVLALGILVGVIFPQLSVEAQSMDPQNYVVMAGGGAPFNTDVLAFAPHSLQVHRGDTIMWAVAGFHNIHLAPTVTEAIIAPEVNGQPLPQVNPAVAFPSVENGGVFTGGDANSGLSLDPANPMVTFSLVIDAEPGTYAYFCDIHPGMSGTITVVDDATVIPAPAEALAAGAVELAMGAGGGVEAAIGASLQPPTTDDEGALQVTAALQTGPAETLQFFPSVAVVEAGQSVTWTVPNNAMSPHTVTWPFIPPGSEFDIVPQDGGPPMIVLNENGFPSQENGAEITNGDGFNTGFIMPGQSFTLKFTEPGVYNYVCFIHSGMQGAVVVMPATA